MFENGLTIWDNAADNGGTALPLKVERSKLGMRVALSQDASTTDCADPAVKCYDAGSANGLLFVRGHATTPAVSNGDAPELAGRVAAVRARAATATSPRRRDECNVQLNARIDIAPNVAANKVTVEAVAGGNDLHDDP